VHALWHLAEQPFVNACYPTGGPPQSTRARSARA
jgi:hypothetical protein